MQHPAQSLPGSEERLRKLVWYWKESILDQSWSGHSTPSDDDLEILVAIIMTRFNAED